MRKGLAVDTISLEQPQLEDVRRRAGSLLKAPWSLTEEKPRVGSVLILDRTTRPTPAEEEVFRIRGGATSALGRSLRASGIWGQRLAPKDYDRIVREMLGAAEGAIVLRRSHFFKETIDNWMLYASAIRFHVGDGEPDEGEREPNPYFLDLLPRPGRGHRRRPTRRPRLRGALQIGVPAFALSSLTSPASRSLATAVWAWLRFGPVGGTRQ